MSEVGNWCLIESDPGVFTEMLRGFGVSGVQVDEIYSVDDLEMGVNKPVYGLIFLFKWRSGSELAGQLATDSDVFFAQQVIPNACATQALINMLMNVSDSNVKIGTLLNDYKEFAKDFDSATRGLCLSNCDEIRKVHNSFARQTLYELDVKGGEAEDVYHFVTYVPVGNKVYELDGLRECPIIAADIEEGKNWVEAVKPIIQQRMLKYSEGEITFNLMAVVPNKLEKLQAELDQLISTKSDDPQSEQQILQLRQVIEDEEDKLKRYKKENIRRRHNYLPFLMELLKCLAKEGKLLPIVDNAIKSAKDRAALAELKRKQ